MEHVVKAVGCVPGEIGQGIGDRYAECAGQGPGARVVGDVKVQIGAGCAVVCPGPKGIVGSRHVDRPIFDGKVGVGDVGGGDGCAKAERSAGGRCVGNGLPLVPVLKERGKGTVQLFCCDSYVMVA